MGFQPVGQLGVSPGCRLLCRQDARRPPHSQDGCATLFFNFQIGARLHFVCAGLEFLYPHLF